MYNRNIPCKVCFIFQTRLNNHSIFNLLYFLCCQTFNKALVNAFYECIHNVYRHFKLKLIINLCFLRVFSHFFDHMNCQFLLQMWCFLSSVTICQSCCTMTHFRPNAVTECRGINTHSAFVVVAEVLTSVFTLLVSI